VECKISKPEHAGNQALKSFQAFSTSNQLQSKKLLTQLCGLEFTVKWLSFLCQKKSCKITP